jgi:hypothetical protein
MDRGVIGTPARASAALVAGEKAWKLSLHAVWRDNPDLILVCVSLSSISGLDNIDRSQALLISQHRFDSGDDRIQAVRKSLTV